MSADETMRVAPHAIARGRLATEQGTAMIAILLLIAVMLALGAFGARSAQIELKIASNEVNAKKALDAAEAGLNHAFNLIKTNGGTSYNDELSSGGTSGALAGLGTLTTLNGVSYRFRSFGGS